MNNEDILAFMDAVNVHLGQKEADLEFRLAETFRDVPRIAGDLSSNVKLISESLNDLNGLGETSLENLNASVIELNQSLAEISDMLPILNTFGISLVIGVGMIIGVLCSKSVWTILR